MEVDDEVEVEAVEEGEEDEEVGVEEEVEEEDDEEVEIRTSSSPFAADPLLPVIAEHWPPVAAWLRYESGGGSSSDGGDIVEEDEDEAEEGVKEEDV